MSTKHLFPTILALIYLCSCFEASLLPISEGKIKITDFIKNQVKPHPQITLDVLLEARKNGKLDELQQYADQINIASILSEVKDRYNAKIQAQRALRSLEKAGNLRLDSQVARISSDNAQPQGLQSAASSQPEIKNDWDNVENNLKKIWDDGKLDGKSSLRMLWLRDFLHKLVDAICDALNID